MYAFFEQNQLSNSSTCSTEDIKDLLQFPWSFSNLVELDGHHCHPLSNYSTIFPLNEPQNFGKHVATQDIEEADEVFEIVEGTNDELIETPFDDVRLISKKKQVSNMDGPTSCIWKSNWWTTSTLSNLTKVSIACWGLLEHVFSYGMVGSLVQLQELHLFGCDNVKVIVEQLEDSETKVNEVSFPRLRSLSLCYLDSLEGFCLGSEAVQWPSLSTLAIKNCPRIIVFTKGKSTTQKLNVIETNIGLCDVKDDINSFIRTKIQEVRAFVIFNSLSCYDYFENNTCQVICFIKKKCCNLFDRDTNSR